MVKTSSKVQLSAVNSLTNTYNVLIKCTIVSDNHLAIYA